MSKRNHISTLFLSLLMPLGLWNVYAQNVDLESLGKGKFKSFNTETWANTTQEIDQVIGQKGAFGNINNLTKFEWIAEASRSNDITVLKELWKNVFIAKADDMFKPVSEGGIGIEKMRQLFQYENFVFENANEFRSLLQNNQVFRNRTLSFIKKE